MPSAISTEPAVTAPQGVGSKTWVPPPFFGDMTIPELYAFHAEKSPRHPVIAFDEEDGSIRTLTFADVFRGIRKAAGIVSGHVQHRTTLGATSDHRHVVGVLAIADSPTYLTLIVGMMYLGLTPFPLSARNSAAAVAHLLRSTDVHELVVTSDAGMQRLAEEAKEELTKEGYDVELLPMPEFGQLYNEDDVPDDVKMGILRGDDQAVIIHSSGSTSFPKPIPITHRNLARWAFAPYFGDIDICGLSISAHGLPLFHVMGVFTITWTVGTGIVLNVFRPSSPPIVSTPDTLLDAAIVSKSDFLFCVPAFIEAWARDPENLPALTSFRTIIYAGAPLNKQVGDYLTNEGVKILTGYGLTETGASTKHFRELSQADSRDWEYITLSPHLGTERIYQEGHPGEFELVYVESPLAAPNVYNSTLNGRPAYATSDLMEEHPTNPALFKVLGRADDQIILSTGEKTNPVPMEAIICQNPNVQAALMFGRGRFQNGVIIQPKEPFDPADEVKLEEFRHKIWPAIESANKFAPSHSRIFKEMITVTNPAKPFQYTAKGTPRRHVCLKDYADEIEEVYRKIEESSQVNVATPEAWTDVTVREYVRKVVQTVMKAPHIGDHDDLFQQGGDSLQATYIRNTILHALRTTTKLSIHDVPLNFVYTNPTISALATYVQRILSGRGVDKEAERAARIAQMEALLDKYSAEFKKSQWTSSRVGSAKSEETVLITGTTGRLGSHLLSQMLQKPEVVRVYALNRGTPEDSTTLKERQAEAFKTWGLDENLLSSKVSFHHADLSFPNFRLDEATFAEIRGSVTSILHNAWRVDFNVSLPSFEPLIAGARKLIDFALNSPVPGGPTVLFVSSISAVLNYSATGPVPETLNFGPELAVGLGYGESKWVTEQLLGRAAKETGLRTVVVRVGQLSGDTRVGGWNVKEWVPAIVRASKLLGCAPYKHDTVSWVPIDIAASTLLEVLHGNEGIVHLTSPRPVTWNDIIKPIAAKLNVPLVPAEEWLKRLRDDAARPGSQTRGHESAHQLIGFFEAAMAEKEVRFGTEKAVKASPTLRDMQSLGEKDALKWLEFLNKVGFLNL
ncbi:acetyl-CoA synthetase-like protein [Lentinus tigrinus ALCF2SS1-7]|uniref:acetyl-CoA synthetase-like protein n=1 Tax=Lentinus tigrinus ALCF2SS1-7 TaxID=1328758 RepID=UPI001166012A|nr:acetyl-CoA synthetase-like protein [Lentinus tigrinus ALCF2SS1-7]